MVMRERERERERQTDRKRERDRDRERHRERELCRDNSVEPDTSRLASRLARTAQAAVGTKAWRE